MKRKPARRAKPAPRRRRAGRARAPAAEAAVAVMEPPPAPEARGLDFAALWKLIPGGYDPVATAGDSWFDPERAQLACDFFPEMLSHIEGGLAGQPFALEPWQQAVIAATFGWVRKDLQGRIVRRFRRVFLYVPRKNGKTPLAAGICVYVLLCDDERWAQIYSAAADSEQASILYKHSRGMIEAKSALADMVTIYGGSNHRSIVLNSDTASVYRVLSSEANTKHGGNSHLVLIDELHAQKDRELVETLRTSMASENRSQPLEIDITTADFLRESICNEDLAYARRVRDGKVNDPTLLPIIYEVIETEDWTKEETWAKANPNLGISVSLEYLRKECARALETPGYQNTFKRLHLNMQTASDAMWLDPLRWQACRLEVAGQAALETILKGRYCYAGLDLSTKLDITALKLVFPPQAGDEDWYELGYYFVPRDNALPRERADNVPYTGWISTGHLIGTPGNVIDYDFVKQRLLDLGKQYEIRAVGYDPWNATQIALQLADLGVEMREFRQGFASMSEPSKELEKLIISQKFRHADSPVMAWMVGNCAKEMDAAGNVKPSKKKSTERIDGVVATIMGIGLATRPGEKDGPSIINSSPRGKAC